MPSFDSVLIANRGEIAVRIIRACRAEKLRSIGIYSDADADALHVCRADEAHRVGPPPPSESYMNVEAILALARSSGAQAIHPGYGFLSENADFAERCQQAGLVWIGPSPTAMRLLGDKAAAKALAERVGVPTLPGYHGAAQDDESLRETAEVVGYPLLVKAAAGGGGRGMRLVRVPGELPEALTAARREALASFGNDRLLLERYLERPRHVEMQIIGDEHGTLLYLGERDCSVQRRHQKIIEEAPAPGFSAEQRQKIGEAAVALAMAAGYTNAGTVEFLLDSAGIFYFLEVNARLQVEHPVTEAVTGLDLVRLQFSVAAGERLPLAQGDVSLRGHAIECRLYAEEPSAGFLPSMGRITKLALPPDSDYWGEDRREDNPLIRRIDRGVERGTMITPFYDPLIAKIIVRHENRTEAIRFMTQTLNRVHVAGIRTNRDFLEAVMASQSFRNGDVHTAFLDDHDLVHQSTLVPDEALMAVAAIHVLLGRNSIALIPKVDEAVRVWQTSSPWRTGWVGAELCFNRGNFLYPVQFAPPVEPGGPWRFRMGERNFERRISVEKWLKHVHIEAEDGSEQTVGVSESVSVYYASLGDRQYRLELVSGLGATPGQNSVAAVSGKLSVTAPMPGRIVKLQIEPGASVSTNQTLLVLEAMKIEHLVTAPRDGIVKSVHYNEGDQVERGAELVELED